MNKIMRRAWRNRNTDYIIIVECLFDFIYWILIWI